jgi:rhamnogalacturonyl hydrolase YesR
VDEEGNVPDFIPSALDNFAPGYAVLFMYEQTGEERYRKAAETIRHGFDNYPRTDYGLFWHSASMPSQAWVDGVYMGQIFLARYGKTVGDSEAAFDIVTEQMTKIAEKCQKENGMLIHAWDESKKARWADPETGLSPEVWSEGMGWYAILMADIFDFLPADHPRRAELMASLVSMCAGLKEVQDPETGMWCQVVDKCGEEGNWNETSGTGMFMYLLQRSIDNGFISREEYQPVVDKAYEGIVKKMQVNQDGFIDLLDCSSIGVKGSYEEYISQPREVSPFTAFGSFMIGAGIVEWGSDNL